MRHDPARPDSLLSMRMFCTASDNLIRQGDCLVDFTMSGVHRSGEMLLDGDIVVIAQKIVSKSEGRTVRLKDVYASTEALRLAEETGKDARIVELILCESVEIVRKRPGLIIARHKSGLVLANAGIDQSNVQQDENDACVLLPPENADASASSLRSAFRKKANVDVAIIINDSLGRPWRQGTVGVAIGSAGLSPLFDLRGCPDLCGRILQTSITASGDQVAAAANLLQGEGAEGRPVVICRGLSNIMGEGCAADLVRPLHEDLFR